MRGLDPRLHPFRRMVDCRVKPGNEDKPSAANRPAFKTTTTARHNYVELIELFTIFTWVSTFLTLFGRRKIFRRFCDSPAGARCLWTSGRRNLPVEPFPTRFIPSIKPHRLAGADFFWERGAAVGVGGAAPFIHRPRGAEANPALEVAPARRGFPVRPASRTTTCSTHSCK
jgi:hypothetical protein